MKEIYFVIIKEIKVARPQHVHIVQRPVGDISVSMDTWTSPNIGLCLVLSAARISALRVLFRWSSHRLTTMIDVGRFLIRTRFQFDCKSFL